MSTLVVSPNVIPEGKMNYEVSFYFDNYESAKNKLIELGVETHHIWVA